MGHAYMGVVVRNILDRRDGQCKGGGFFLKEKARQRVVKCLRNVTKTKISQPRYPLHKFSTDGQLGGLVG